MGRKRTLVCGVGINDFDKPISSNGKHIPQYKMWTNMLTRSFDKSFKTKHPSYCNVTCDPSWLYISNFIKDVSEIKNFEKGLTEGWCLDKDILFKGNKIYSKDTCCFVPKDVNNIILTNRCRRGDFPIGVSYSKHAGKFRAYMINASNTQMHLGYYKDVESAFDAYRKAKTEQIKDIAEKYKNVIDIKVYNALLSWEIDIND